MVLVKHPPTTWRRFIDLMRTQKIYLAEISADFEITPQMAHAIDAVPAAGSITMKALAEEMLCDASNATGIVDRLEARGLAVRRPDASDRRVKSVVLTAAGKRLRRKLDERLNQAPPAIAALSAEDQATLDAILARALTNAAEQRARKTAS